MKYGTLVKDVFDVAKMKLISIYFCDCKFSQAVWFASSLGLRVEGLQELPTTHIQDIIHYILTIFKNDDTLPTILAILWSIWKARNDLLFNRNYCSPLHVLFKAKALQAEKEVNLNTRTQDQVIVGCTNTRMNQSESDWNRIGRCNNIYTDAKWKGITSPSNENFFHKERAGLGIFFDWNREDHHAIFLQVASFASSALQAEAQAMELAAQIG
jgi:hypothetical protein